MKPLLLPVAALAFFTVDGTPETDYAAKRTLRIVASTSLEMETTDFSMERDGEPVGGGFGGGGGALEERTVEQTFTVVAHSDGAPTKVQRAYETVKRTTTAEMGEETVEGGSEGPLQGVTLELTEEDGEVSAEVIDGDAPDNDAVLEGHSLTLALDALLPQGEVAEEDTFEIESDAVMKALGLDMENGYFPREERSEEAEGGEGRRGGRRGGRGGAPGGSTFGNLANVEWSGEGTFNGETEHEGLTCLEFTLEFEAEGDLPERETSGRGRMPELGVASPAVENTISANIEGRLLFDAASGMPVLLELEGTIETVSHNEFSRGETSMTMHTEREGAFEYRVEVTVETDE